MNALFDIAIVAGIVWLVWTVLTWFRGENRG